MKRETIAAISTGMTNAGIGIVRISGEDAFSAADRGFRGKEKISECKSHTIHYGYIIDGDITVDQVLVMVMKGPRTFTGEDTVEINCHGGTYVVTRVLDAVLRHGGVRPAQPGEFTKRAFLNGKMDLSQAEAVADLIHAKTRNFVMQSAKNLSGILRDKILEIKGGIFDTLSKIVAGIDFPEDVAEPEYSYLIESFEKSLSEIDEILSCVRSSNIMRQGIKVAIVGRPNVGKSSLFNALLNANRAIVTDIAGTTRDVIKETLDLDIAVTLIDTAGIRDSEDVGKVEEIGIEFSKQSADEADLVIFLYDASAGLTNEDKEIFELVKNKPHLQAANKCDLIDKRSDGKIYISTRTGEGIQELREMIKNKVCDFSLEDTEYITNERQADCLKKCRESLIRALDAAKIGELQDLISIDLKSALLFLDEITGEVITDDILNNIFDHFCIGK